MSDRDEPTQTTPKGAEIPIPTRDAFLRDLAKVVPPAPEGETDEKPSKP
jgi:hypothetical protein